ncbi:hypothetical protein EI74_0695 [Mycoplasma testudineum]|uniref:Uncharacterized protein n=1 Tax=Mycoplasma testudineum TaxID=244584 RepID=A0A4R6IC64_9MOLU|nr:hypothetical protein [Mycoplasma testudineum]OYD26592.1 hypothetical protein CG473_03070 [Mycoplasma testudineum]TDO19424.1 hypothetical protein EI74_0695 [Mycoplasma testudineum]
MDEILKKEKLVEYFSERLKKIKRKLKISILLALLFNFISIFFSLLIVALAISVLSIILIKEQNLTSAQITVINNSTFVKGLGIDVNTAILLAKITSIFLIMIFFLNLFLQFYQLNGKHRKYRKVKRSLNYYLIHFSEDESYSVERFMSDTNAVIENFKNQKLVTQKEFILKWFKGDF